MYEWKLLNFTFSFGDPNYIYDHFESSMEEIEKEGWEVFEIMKMPHGVNLYLRRSKEKTPDKIKELEDRIEKLEHIIESEQGSRLEI